MYSRLSLYDVDMGLSGLSVLLVPGLENKFCLECERLDIACESCALS